MNMLGRRFRREFKGSRASYCWSPFFPTTSDLNPIARQLRLDNRQRRMLRDLREVNQVNFQMANLMQQVVVNFATVVRLRSRYPHMTKYI